MGSATTNPQEPPMRLRCSRTAGTLEMREGVVGIGVFDDGSECDEWAYSRGECSPDSNS